AAGPLALVGRAVLRRARPASRKGARGRGVAALRPGRACARADRSVTLGAGIAGMIIHDELILGIDEAGRGPVLGPMVMACVALRPRKASALTRAGVTDSKRFSGEKAHESRLELVPRILDACDHAAVMIVDVADIDRR